MQLRFNILTARKRKSQTKYSAVKTIKQGQAGECFNCFIWCHVVFSHMNGTTLGMAILIPVKILICQTLFGQQFMTKYQQNKCHSYQPISNR